MLLPPGTPIAVMAPAGVYDPDRLARGFEIARARGHELILLPQEPWRYLAGDDARRLAQLDEALRSPNYGAVWAARGGFGVTRLLPRLDWENLPPRILIGFSDLTPLLDALRREVGSAAIHGPVVHSLSSTDPESLDHLFALLAGQDRPIPGRTWVEGTAEGPVVGGNLALIAATCGTPWQLDARGAILVLEDVGEPPYRIDRMLQQLRSAGVFAGVAGLAFGEFTGCTLPDGADWTLRDVLLDQTAHLGVPILGDLPIGHGSANRAFRVGAWCRLADGVLRFEPSTTEA